MSKHRIIAVGKLPSEYGSVFNHFSSMVGRSLEVVEIISKKNTIDHESELILSKISKGSFLILLDILGAEYSSENFAKLLQDIAMQYNEINFIIGGSYGVSDKIKKLVNIRLSFSKMTFPHMLARIMLLEQIYRAQAINYNHPYHK